MAARTSIIKPALSVVLVALVSRMLKALEDPCKIILRVLCLSIILGACHAFRLWDVISSNLEALRIQY